MDEKLFIELINQHNELCNICDISFRNVEKSVGTLKKMCRRNNKKVMLLAAVLGCFMGYSYCKYEEMKSKIDILSNENRLKIDELNEEMLQIRAKLNDDIDD